MHPDEKKKLVDQAEASGYLPHIRALAKFPAIPLWWSRSSLPVGEAILHNGTLTAIDTGARTICVTADHVYEGYLADCTKFDDIECQIGNVRVDLSNYLIDRSSQLDLATFEIPKTLVAASGVSPHGARVWPSVDLKESDIVVLGGYPGMLRKERVGEVDLSFVSFLARVAQASSDHSAVQLNLIESYWPDKSRGIAPGSDLGGMSGGPIFRFMASPVEHLEIAGFIYEAQPNFEIVFARNASSVNPNGIIAGSA